MRLFSFNQTQEQQVFQLLQSLKQRPIIHPKLMINALTFGLHGTQKLKQIQCDDDWVYLPDTIQEGNALHSLDSSKAVDCWMFPS